MSDKRDAEEHKGQNKNTANGAHDKKKDNNVNVVKGYNDRDMKDMKDHEKALRVRTDARQTSVLDFFKGAQAKAAQLQDIKSRVLTDDVLRKMHGDFARWRQDRKNDAVCDRKLSET